MHRSLKTLVSVLAIVVLSSCGDGGGTVEPPAGSLTVIGGSARAAGLLSARVQDVSLTVSEYEAELGGEPMTLVVTADSQLVGLVPELPAGRYELQVAISGRSLATEVTVLAAVAIADPEAFVAGALNEAVAGYPEAPPEGVDAEEWAADRQEFLESVEDARAAMAGATAEEQLAAARLLNEVRAALGPLADGAGVAAFASAAAAAADATCAQATTEAVISGLAYYAGIGTVVAGAVVPGVNFLVVLPGVLLVKKALPAVERDIQAMFAACSSQTLVGLTTSRMEGGPGARSLASSSSGFEFARGVARPAWPVEDVRPFSASDIEDEGAKRLSSAMDWVHEQVALLPAWIRDRLPKLPSRPSQQEEQAPVRREAAPAAVRIENVTNGVTLNAVADGDRLLLTADAPGSDSIAFTFDVVSTSDDEVRQTMSAVMLAHAGVVLSASVDSVRGTTTFVADPDIHVLECDFEYDLLIAGVDQATFTSYSLRRVVYTAETPGGNVTETTDPTTGTYAAGLYAAVPFSVQAYYNERNPVSAVTETFGFTWRNDATGDVYDTNDLTVTCYR